MDQISPFSSKVRCIVSPFWWIAVGCIAGYTALNWLLFIQIGWPHLDEMVIKFWLPIAIPWVPFLIWLRPGLRKLKPMSRRDDSNTFLYMLGCAAIVVPTIIAQEYLERATGKMTTLTHISQASARPPTRYYAVKDLGSIRFDRTYTARYATVGTSGKYGQYLDFDFYYACPMGDTFSEVGESDVWLAMRYHYQTSSRVSTEERESLYRNYRERADAKYWSAKLGGFSYLVRVSNSAEGRGFTNAIKRAGRMGPATVILQAETGDFAARMGTLFPWIFGSFGIGAAVWLGIVAAIPLDPAKLRDRATGQKQKVRRPDPLFFLGMFRSGTAVLVLVNVAIFLAMVFAGLGVVSVSASDLHSWGGSFGPDVRNGEVWRLVSAMFLHAGLMHLFQNMALLFLTGIILEQSVGHGRFLTCYFVTGICAGMASIVWQPATVSVGASGAIFGICGALLAITGLRPACLPLTRAGMLKFVGVIVGINLVLGAISVGVDTADHIGGLAAGLVMGGVFSFWPNAQMSRKKRVSRKPTKVALEAENLGGGRQ